MDRLQVTTEIRVAPPLSRFQAIAGVSRDGDWAGTWLIACSASAVIVSAGLTPRLTGTADPSTTYRFGWPKTRPRSSHTPSSGPLPMTAPPRMCAVDGISNSTSLIELEGPAPNLLCHSPRHIVGDGNVGRVAGFFRRPVPRVQASVERPVPSSLQDQLQVVVGDLHDQQQDRLARPAERHDRTDEVVRPPDAVDQETQRAREPGSAIRERLGQETDQVGAARVPHRLDVRHLIWVDA